jgi:hypothetical protein
MKKSWNEADSNQPKGSSIAAFGFSYSRIFLIVFRQHDYFRLTILNCLIMIPPPPRYARSRSAVYRGLAGQGSFRSSFV